MAKKPKLFSLKPHYFNGTTSTHSEYELKFPDFIAGVSKDMPPYMCTVCNNMFNGLGAYILHNRYYFANRKTCPSDKTLQNLFLEKKQFQGNGHQYQVWTLIPTIAPTGNKDELLTEMENRAFPNFKHQFKHQI
jgi:hypothetical protein